MPTRRSIEFIKDIKEAIRRINDYIKNIEYDAFLEDIRTQDAVVRNFEVIGEAAKHISQEIREKY